MNRQISNEAFFEILESGLLTKRRRETLELIRQFGPISANDLVRKARDNGFKGNQTGLNARFSELEKMGVIERTGEKRDSVSGKINGLYWLTGNKPKPLPKITKIKCNHCNGKGFFEQLITL